jgi:hypothetical protein
MATSFRVIFLLLVTTVCIDCLLLLSHPLHVLASPAADGRAYYLQHGQTTRVGPHRPLTNVERVINNSKPSSTAHADSRDDTTAAPTLQWNRKRSSVNQVFGELTQDDDGDIRSKMTSAGNAVVPINWNRYPVKRQMNHYCCIGDIFCVLGRCNSITEDNQQTK